jgi:integrase
MGTEKEPLTENEEEVLIDAAKGFGEFEHQTILVLLDTGMHVSVLCKPKYGLHIEGEHLVWGRPKKSGKQSMTRIKISKRLKPFIKAYVETPRPGARQYYNEMFHKIGKQCGLYNISPMSCRHTLAVKLLKRGISPTIVKDILNCSLTTLGTYGKFTTRMVDKSLDGIGW